MEDKQERISNLAREILKLSRNTLLVNLRFLDSALSRLTPEENPELSFATDGTIIPAIALLVLFLVITVLGFFMILFKLIGILAKKNDGYQGSFFVTLSQIFRIFSVIPPVVLITPYFEQYGLTHEQGYFVFGVEAACVAVFVTTLVSSVIGLVSKKEDAAPKNKYIFSIIGNCISIATLLTLGMLNIWGI